MFFQVCENVKALERFQGALEGKEKGIAGNLARSLASFSIVILRLKGNTDILTLEKVPVQPHNSSTKQFQPGNEHRKRARYFASSITFPPADMVHSKPPHPWATYHTTERRTQEEHPSSRRPGC